MKHFKTAIALCVPLVLLQAHASAAPIVDQNNSSTFRGFCTITENFNCGQSFYQAAGSISGAGIYIHPDWFATRADLSIGIFGAITGDNVLALGKATGVDSNSGWVDVFWDPVALVPTTQYFLLLSATNRELVAAYSAAGSYADGAAVSSGRTYSGFDLTFRTYAGDSAADLPEPASLALLGMGLLGLAAIRSRLARR